MINFNNTSFRYCPQKNGGLLAIAITILLMTIVRPGWAQTKVHAPITLEVLDRVTVAAHTNGFIHRIPVRSGDLVQSDDLIVEFDTTKLELQLRAAENEHEALVAKARNRGEELASLAREKAAKLNVDKLSEVKSQYGQVVPQLEMTRAQSELEETTAQKESAIVSRRQFAKEAEAKKNELQMIQLDINKSKIYGQFDGVIASVLKYSNDFVERGEPIAEVYRMDVLSGVLLVDQNKLPPVNAVGMPVRVVIQSTDEEPVDLSVEILRVFPRIDVDGKYMAYVEIRNELDPISRRWKFRPGMVGQATITSTEANSKAKRQASLMRANGDKKFGE